MALSFSTFFYEILDDPENACHIAKSAFDDAISELDSIPEELLTSDVIMLMQMLRDNLTLWTADMSTDVIEKG